MNLYSIYALDTGFFTGTTISCPHSILNANVPDGCSCMLGEYDHHSQKVDLTTHAVVDYKPAQPSPNHEWRDDIKRWVYVPTALESCMHARVASYPPLTDLADALYWQARGNPEPMQRYLAAVDAVKHAHPKP